MISIFGTKVNADYDKLAYDFNFNDIDGSQLKLSEYKGKVIIVAGVSKVLIEKGLKAGDWVREAAKICGGGGGGRSDTAQAGGKEPEKIPVAMENATVFANEVTQ